MGIMLTIPRVFVLPIALLMPACATTAPPERVVDTVEVQVPVPVSCVPDGLPDGPEYADSREALLSAPGPAERYALVQAGREQRNARLAEIEPIIRGCRQD